MLSLLGFREKKIITDRNYHIFYLLLIAVVVYVIVILRRETEKMKMSNMHHEILKVSHHIQKLSVFAFSKIIGLIYNVGFERC